MHISAFLLIYFEGLVLALDVLAFMFSCLLVFTGTCSSLRWFDVLGGGRLGWPNERPLHGNWSGVDR